MYACRYKLAREFLTRLEREHAHDVDIYVVELAYGGQAFYLAAADNPRHLRVTTTTAPLWHKENMINMAVRRLLPLDWRAMAWIDADVEFQSPTWPSDTLAVLLGGDGSTAARYDVVQLFGHALQMAKTGEAGTLTPSFGYQAAHHRKRVEGVSPVNYWHPGFAWAMTRAAYDQLGGLFDRSMVGAADYHMAMCLVGEGATSVHGLMPAAYKQLVARYEARCPGLRLGYVQGVLWHHYHGEPANRKYRERWSILTDHAFDPMAHLEARASDGLLIPTPACPAPLLADIMTYFLQRDEDEGLPPACWAVGRRAAALPARQWRRCPPPPPSRPPPCASMSAPAGLPSLSSSASPSPPPTPYDDDREPWPVIGRSGCSIAPAPYTGCPVKLRLLEQQAVSATAATLGTPKLPVMVVMSNPLGFARRWHLARECIHRLRTHFTQSVEVYVVELAHDDVPFHVTHHDDERCLQLRTSSSALWHKENLINLGIRALLPRDWTAVAWVDADIEFENEAWAVQAQQLLGAGAGESYDLVQLFSLVVDMDAAGNAMEVYQGFGSQHVRQHPRPYERSPLNLWHPGFGWAMSRAMYERCGGLFEWGIVGGGDAHLAMSVLGAAAHTLTNTGVTAEYTAALMAFQSRVQGARLGYVPGTIRHHYHGKKVDRQYGSRWSILARHAYVPGRDVEHRRRDGLLVPSATCAPQLLADVRAFFAARNEDGE